MGWAASPRIVTWDLDVETSLREGASGSRAADAATDDGHAGHDLTVTLCPPAAAFA